MTSLSRGQIRLMQTNINERLKARGRHPITVDGVYGAQTRKAVHLTKYLLGFPLKSLDSGPSGWFRRVVQHPALRPPSYYARARSRDKYLHAQHKTAVAKGAWGLDWAWGTPNYTALKAAGVKFAARYLSYDPGKNLSAAQARKLAAQGIACVVVWETTANRARAGFTAGANDAREAQRQASACGMPSDRPIYFAVDFDGTTGTVASYFRGVRSVLGYDRTGVYGSASIVDGLRKARLCRWGWQTYAWSGGRLSTRAQLYQYSNGHSLAGVSCDYNRSLAADFGQWTPRR